MRIVRNRWKKILAVCAVGSLFQFATGGGCPQFAANLGLSAFDFCAVLNCTNGTFFNLCDPVVLLVDCL